MALLWSRSKAKDSFPAFPVVSEYSDECCDGSDWLSIRRSVMSKLEDPGSLLTACPSSPLVPSLLLRRSPKCSALDTLDCISINSSVKSSAHWRKVYRTPFRLSSSPPPMVRVVGGYACKFPAGSMLRFPYLRRDLFLHFCFFNKVGQRLNKKIYLFFY